MTIGFELKKLLKVKHGFILIIVAICIKIIIYSFPNASGYVNQNMEKYKSDFMEYMSVLSGELNDEKSKYIADEQKYFSELNDKNSKIFDEYSNGIVTECDFIDFANEYNSAQERKNAFNIVQEQYNNALKNDRSYFMYYNGWAFLLGTSSPDWILIILVAMLSAIALSTEQSSGMAELLDTTRNGKARLHSSKIFAVLFISAAVSLLFTSVEILYAHLRYGLSNCDFPLESITEFQNSELRFSLFEGALFLWLNRAFGCVLLAAIVFCICKITRNSMTALFVGIGSVFLPIQLYKSDPIQYRMPLPCTFLRGAAILRSKFQLTPDNFIVITTRQYITVLIIGIVLFVASILSSIFGVKLRIKRIIPIFCCVAILICGCTSKRNVCTDTVINNHGKYEITENSQYYFINKHNQILMVDKADGKETEMLRFPFENTNKDVNYSSIFADDNAFYRLERITENPKGEYTLYTEQIIKTSLSDFSEKIIYKDEILKDRGASYFGIGEYIPYETVIIEHINCFAVIAEKIILEKNDILYLYDTKTKKSEKIIDEKIYSSEWAIVSNMIYYVDNLFRLHCMNAHSGEDNIITEKRANGVFLTKDSIYFRSVTDGGSLFSSSLKSIDFKPIVPKSNNCFAADNEYIYYTDSNDNNSLHVIDISTNEDYKISDKSCSFVYPISDAEFFYYSYFDDITNETVLKEIYKDELLKL